MLNWPAAIPAAAIALREGTEAFLVVGIVFACLARAKQTVLRPWVYAGIGAGLASSVLSGLLVRTIGQQTDRLAQSGLWSELWKGSISLVAVMMLSWMLVWMTSQSRQMRSMVTNSVEQVLASSSGWPIFSLVALAVGREGLETVVFVLSQTDGSVGALVGAMGGWLAAALLVTLLLAGTMRIDLGQFFRIMGLLLLLVVGGLVVSTLQHLDSAALLGMQPEICHWQSPGVCNLGPVVWDWHRVLPDDRFPGLLLKTLLGYRDRLYALQLIAYLVFWVAIGGTYWLSLNPTTTSITQKES
jgi:high-affinity iron transporter